MKKTCIPATLAVFALSCGNSPETTEAKKEPPPTPVAVAKVHLGLIEKQVTLQAEFRPYEEVELHAKVAGYLKEIKVDVGDRVIKGQLIATLEIPEMTEDRELAAATSARSESEVQRAKAQLQQAEASHSMSHLATTRMLAVSKSRPNLVAQSEIDDAQARDRAAEANVATAKASIASAEQQLRASVAGQSRTQTLEAYSRITAPFAGLITKRYADPGAMIQAGTASQTQAMPLVRLSQDDRLRLAVPAPESLVPQIRVGTKVAVRVPALHQTFNGLIARYSGRVQTSTRTMETEIDVVNTGHLLKPGMIAEADFVIERKSGALTAPVLAISNASSNPTVLAVNAQNRIESKPVKIGIEAPDKIEILSGVEEGQLVVAGGQNRLHVGQLVAPILPSPAGAR